MFGRVRLIVVFTAIFCIFWPMFGWCALQMLVEVCFSPFFFAKKHEKERKKEQKGIKSWSRVLSIHKRTPQPSFGCKPSITPLFASFCFISFCLLFCPLLHFLAKNVKKHISTSVWCAQHSNTGWNIQHTGFLTWDHARFWAPLVIMVLWSNIILAILMDWWGINQ